MKKNAMLIDVYYCTGCHSCEVACQQENGFAAGVYGIKVTEMLLEKGDGLTIDYVPYRRRKAPQLRKALPVPVHEVRPRRGDHRRSKGSFKAHAFLKVTNI